jgi:hypothetical protein
VAKPVPVEGQAACQVRDRELDAVDLPERTARLGRLGHGHFLPWESLGLWYRPDWSPLLVTINHVNDRPTPVAGSLFASDVGRMGQALAEFPPSQGRDLVLGHYFVKHSGTIVHIEGNGFYQAEKLILETSRF